MKRTRFVFAFLVLAVVAVGLMAEDNPFLGTWKLNVAKTKMDPGTTPRSQTRTVIAEGAGAKYSFEGVAADGTPYAYSFTSQYDGKDSPVTGTGIPGGADSITIKRISANKTTGTWKKNGKEVRTVAAEVSKDGKVTIIRGTGKNADGKEYHTISVYDKQ